MKPPILTGHDPDKALGGGPFAPCPFPACRSRATQVAVGTTTYQGGRARVVAWIECAACGARGPAVVTEGCTSAELMAGIARGSAAALWNQTQGGPELAPPSPN